MNPYIGDISSFFYFQWTQLTFTLGICWQMKLCLHHSDTVRYIKTAIGKNNISWQQAIKYSTGLSEKFITNPATPSFRNKWNCSLRGNTNQNLHGIMMFVGGPCYCSGQQIGRALNKHFKTVDNNSYIFSKWTPKTFWHSLPQAVVTNRGHGVKKLSQKRRQGFLSAIKRDNLTQKILSNDRICSKHFVSGKLASLLKKDEELLKFMIAEVKSVWQVAWVTWNSSLPSLLLQEPLSVASESVVF